MAVHLIRVALLGVVLAVGFTPAAFGQDGSPATFRSGVDAVTVTVAVRDARGRVVVALFAYVYVGFALLVAAVGVCRLGDWSLGPASLRNWAVLTTAGLSASAIYFVLVWLLVLRRRAG